MQVRDNDTQLLYGLFQGICSWAMERGYKDISGMKNLLKLAMVDTCRQMHTEKSSFAAQMAIVTDLGISLRNVQYTLKRLEELQDLSGDLIKIREIQKEISIALLREPQTADQIFAEVSYLIHAPHDLQKRTLRTILNEMVNKGVLRVDEENGRKIYRTEKTHVDLLDMSDLSARISGLLTHIDAYNNTIGEPLFETYQLTEQQARGLQKAINEFLRGTGNAYENECKEEEEITQPYYFYLGSSKVEDPAGNSNLTDVMLKVVHSRFAEIDSASIGRNHWYQLSPAAARAVCGEVKNFIVNEGISASENNGNSSDETYAFYFGMADHQSESLDKEI